MCKWMIPNFLTCFFSIRFEWLYNRGAYSIVSDGAGQVYWYGGSDVYFYSPVNDLKVFNPLLKTWTMITPKLQIDTQGGEFPFLEYCDAMEPLDTDVEYCGGPCLFAFGGYDHHELKCSDNLYRYDILSSTWITMSSTIKPIERSSGTMVHLRNKQKLLLYGGSGVEHKQYYDDLWTFDLSKERRGWQRVYATGTAPENCNNNSSNTARTKSVVVIKGSEPKILVLQESDTAMTRKEIVFYFLDCLTLNWTRFNSHIQMELIFASIFQPKYSSSLDGNQCYLYLASPHGHQRIYYIFLKNNEMPQQLYHASLQGHLCDVVIDFD